MARYAKPRAVVHWDDEHPSFSLYDSPGSGMTLSVDDHEAIDTGVIYPTGEPVMRLPNPIGFGRDEEW